MTSRWWRDRRGLRRFAADLLRDELARGRRNDAGLPPPPWDDALRFDADLGADSLERLALATALAEAIQLHRSGIEDGLLVRRTLGDWLYIAEAGLDRHDAELTFRTSGTTGTPRACTHRLECLEQEAEWLATRLGPRSRIVRAVPSHHIYGFLFTLLLPRALGLDGDRVIDARSASPSSVVASLREGDLVVGHPDFWRAVTRCGARPPRDVTGVTSTAPCPDDVARAVQALGISPLLQVYGASETAGIGWRVEPASPFELMPFWRAEGDDLVRIALSGEEIVARPPDRLEWRDAMRFELRERKDGAVQVGGINVWPAEVRRVLLEHPHVRDASVRLMREDEGARLKAFIVPSRDELDVGTLESSLRDWIDQRLAPPARPKALRFGAALPVTATGKLADWRLDPA